MHREGLVTHEAIGAVLVAAGGAVPVTTTTPAPARGAPCPVPLDGTLPRCR